MTARELLDNLSDTLILDDRILSASERELVTNLLDRTTARAGGREEVAKAITRSVGELVAERALGVLGQSITHRLLQQQVATFSNFLNQVLPVTHAGSPPVSPPSPGAPGSQPRPPGSGPPSIAVAATSSRAQTGGVAVLESAELWPAESVIFDEFLAPAELGALMQFTLDREMQFQISEVIAPGVAGGAIDYEQRRSRVLIDLGQHQTVIADRLLGSLPRVLRKWGRDPFPVSRIETQITSSNHGDFFRWHNDNGAEEVMSREITFVYFFHREPKKFRGGELRIYDSRLEGGRYVPTANYRTIVPQQNQLVLFPSALAHEISPVECPSGAFADSRFTVNGWLHK